jgi:putative flippase GtrA
LATTSKAFRGARPGPCFLDFVLGSTLRRFLLVGGVSYLVNQAALIVLYELILGGASRATIAGVWPVDVALLLASVLALEFSILVRFTLNDVWTFRDRGARSLAGRFYLFQVGSLLSPVVALVVVNVLTPMFGLDYLIANSLGILLGLAWNWYCSSQLVWRPVAVLTGTGSRSGNS